MLSNISSSNVSSSVSTNNEESKKVKKIEEEIKTINQEICGIKSVNESQSQDIKTIESKTDSLSRCISQDFIQKNTGCFDVLKTKEVDSTKATIDNISSTTLDSDCIRSPKIDSDVVNAGTIDVDDVTTKTLSSNTLSSNTLSSTNAEICALNTNDITTKNLNIDSINLSDMSSSKAVITNAEVDVLNTKDYIKAPKITTDVLVVKKADITDALIGGKDVNENTIVLQKYLTSTLTTDYEIVSNDFKIVKTGKVYHVQQKSVGFVLGIFNDGDTTTIELKESGIQAKIRYIGEEPLSSEEYNKTSKTTVFDLLAENKIDVVVASGRSLLGCLSSQITGCICDYDDLYVDNLHSLNNDYINIDTDLNINNNNINLDTLKLSPNTIAIDDTTLINKDLASFNEVVVNNNTTKIDIKPNIVSFCDGDKIKGSLSKGQLFISNDNDDCVRITPSRGFETRVCYSDKTGYSSTEVSQNRLCLTHYCQSTGCMNNVIITPYCTSLPESTINGSLCVVGDICQTGSSYITHAEDLNINCCTITTRSNATSAMADSEYSGLKVCMGKSTSEDLYVVAKNDGQLYIGKEDSLEAIATRTDLSDGCFVKYDAVNKTLVNAEDPKPDYSTLTSGCIVCFDGTKLANAIVDIDCVKCAGTLTDGNYQWTSSCLNEYLNCGTKGYVCKSSCAINASNADEATHSLSSDVASYANSTACATNASCAINATNAVNAVNATNASCASCDGNGLNISNCYSKKQSSCNTDAVSMYGCVSGTNLYLYTC